jgi:hypothetical protein
MGSVPPSRGGMGSAFLDLTRDLGGAVMQAIMGALLAAAYAFQIRTDLSNLSPAEAAKVSDQTAAQLTSSFEGAASVASKYGEPTSTRIIDAASVAFTEGKSAAILIALVMTLLGLALVLFVYPGKSKEEAYYADVLSGKVPG